MRIGTVAKKAGVGVETVRFYERKGLIAQPPKPANGGFRRYPEDTVRRVRFIKHSQALGFTLSEAEELLSLEADPNTDCSAVRAQAQHKLANVRQKIVSLRAIETALGEIIDTCPGHGPASEHCSILAALRPDGSDPQPQPSRKG